MERLKAIVVDDEELARSVIHEMLEPHAEIEVTAECANGFEAVKAVSEHKPDIIFLDIQMPKLDGFEVLDLIGQEAAVVFVTAYDSFAIRAFDVHAVDYLLKPFSQARFDEALARARARAGQKMPQATELAAAARPSGQYLERLAVKDGAKVFVIPVSKLDYIEAQDDYVSIHSEGKSVMKQQTISSVETSLDPSRFVRIHRSVIVNVERVAKIEPYGKDSKVAILTTGARLPVSRAGYSRLELLLNR